MSIDETRDLVILAETKTQPDDTIVHTVFVGALAIPANDRDAAEAMAEAIVNAVNEHSPVAAGWIRY